MCIRDRLYVAAPEPVRTGSTSLYKEVSTAETTDSSTTGIGVDALTGGDPWRVEVIFCIMSGMLYGGGMLYGCLLYTSRCV